MSVLCESCCVFLLCVVLLVLCRSFLSPFVSPFVCPFVSSFASPFCESVGYTKQSGYMMPSGESVCCSCKLIL